MNDNGVRETLYEDMLFPLCQTRIRQLGRFIDCETKYTLVSALLSRLDYCRHKFVCRRLQCIYHGTALAYICKTCTRLRSAAHDNFGSQNTIGLRLAERSLAISGVQDPSWNVLPLSIRNISY